MQLFGRLFCCIHVASSATTDLSGCSACAVLSHTHWQQLIVCAGKPAVDHLVAFALILTPIPLLPEVLFIIPQCASLSHNVVVLSQYCPHVVFSRGVDSRSATGSHSTAQYTLDSLRLCDYTVALVIIAQRNHVQLAPKSSVIGLLSASRNFACDHIQWNVTSGLN